MGQLNERVTSYHAQLKGLAVARSSSPATLLSVEELPMHAALDVPGLSRMHARAQAYAALLTATPAQPSVPYKEALEQRQLMTMVQDVRAVD